MPRTTPLEREATGPCVAELDWDAFLREFASLVLQVVHLFERDADQIEDCFVFVCERLRQDNLRRIRRYRAAGAASFPTWLRAVVRNLCLDWRRARFGRTRLPRSIARLPPLDQEVFRAVHLRGLCENEALHALQAVVPGLTRAQFDDSLTRIGRSLSSRQTWLLVTRRPRVESLSAAFGEDDPRSARRDPPDPRVDPEVAAEREEAQRAVSAALGHLPSGERLLLRLRFEQELTLEQIARLTGLENAAAAERAVQKALGGMRGELSARGLAAVSVKGR